MIRFVGSEAVELVEVVEVVERFVVRVSRVLSRHRYISQYPWRYAMTP